jgi:hypothetical protein
MSYACIRSYKRLASNMIQIEEPHHHKDEQEELAAQKARQRTSLLHYGINHFVLFCLECLMYHYIENENHFNFYFYFI